MEKTNNHLSPYNITEYKKKPTTYDVGNSDLGLENAKIWRGSTGKWEKIPHNIKLFTYNV
jgi:hypothetical protein